MYNDNLAFVLVWYFLNFRAYQSTLRSWLTDFLACFLEKMISVTLRIAPLRKLEWMFKCSVKCPNVQSSVPMFKCLVRCSGKRGNRFSKKVEKATTTSLFVPLVSTTSSCSNEKWVHFACEVRSEMKQKEIFRSYKIKNHLQCLHFGINFKILQSLERNVLLKKK